MRRNVAILEVSSKIQLFLEQETTLSACTKQLWGSSVLQKHRRAKNRREELLRFALDKNTAALYELRGAEVQTYAAKILSGHCHGRPREGGGGRGHLTLSLPGKSKKTGRYWWAKMAN